MMGSILIPIGKVKKVSEKLPAGIRKFLVLSVSEVGLPTFQSVTETLRGDGYEVDGFTRYETFMSTVFKEPVSSFLQKNMRKYDAIVVIMSLNGTVRVLEGIAISKFHDPPVLAMDDLGRFIIPVLSGHAGAGNQISRYIGGKVSSVPVITDGLESTGRKSVEEIARDLFCSIYNKESTLQINAGILRGDTIPIVNASDKREKLVEKLDYSWKQDSCKGSELCIMITSEPGAEKGVCYLVPDDISIGVGYRKDVKSEDLIECIQNVCSDLNLDASDITLVSSFKHDSIIRQATQKLNIEFRPVNEDEINRVDDTLLTHHSEKAKETFNVKSVAEPSAIASLGPGSKLILPFSKHQGKITAAVASRSKLFKGKITFMGVGPSDPSLMTVRARDAIVGSHIVAGYQTPINIADSVIGKKHRIVFKWKEQQKYVEETLRRYDEGYEIAFLFTGDSCFTETELMRRFTDKIDNYEIIPGISSIQAASARSHMPLEMTPVISFHVTGDIEDRKLELLDRLRNVGRVLVVPRPWDFMPNNIGEFLLKEQFQPYTKITVMEKLTSEEEKITVTDLGSIGNQKFSDLSIMAIGNSYF